MNIHTSFDQDIKRAAAQIAAQNLDGFRAAMLTLPLTVRQPHETPLMLGLWRRYVELRMRAGLEPRVAAKQQVLLDQIEGFAANPSNNSIWGVFHEMRGVEEVAGLESLAEFSYSLIAPHLPGLVEGAIDNILATIFTGSQHRMFEHAFLFVLARDKAYVPNYWLFQSLVRSWRETHGAQSELPVAAWTTANGRKDLEGLFSVYADFVVQTSPAKIASKIKALADGRQRELVLEYLLRVPSTPEDLPETHALYDDLAPATQEVERRFLAARLAISQSDWAAAVENAAAAQDDPRLGPEALCLKALGQAHQGAYARAEGAMVFVRGQSHAPWWLKGRAHLLSANITRLEKVGTYQQPVAPGYLDAGVGRPLVQALWVGPKLRWIEELSMLSFLQNGWRYHLYAYDDIENLPDGVEVMDASLIVPRDEVFTEKAKSGAHKGSLGAFSDLFRYALLAKKGGLYCDTDVINLRRFDAQGAKFVSTEHTDAGLIAVNGALMAATPNDPLQVCALDLSRAHVESDDLEFTKIGPALLARMFATGNYLDYAFLPYDFMNPIPCCRTSALLEPSERFLSRPEIAHARNVHVYTETWRVMGMDLRRPPSDETFIGKLYSRLKMARDANRGVLDLMEA